MSCDGLKDKMVLQRQTESVLTIKVTSLMAKRALNVKKNWLKAAHFQCRLSWRILGSASEAGS